MILLGWFAVIGWQSGMATVSYSVAQQLQGLMVLNMPDYTIKGWHSTLFVIAIAAFSIFWNTILFRTLPRFEIVGITLHVCGFIVFVVVLWVMAPKTDPHTVFTEFQDNGGWGNQGVQRSQEFHHRRNKANFLIAILPCRSHRTRHNPNRLRLLRPPLRRTQRRILGPPPFHGRHRSAKLYPRFHNDSYYNVDTRKR